MSPELQADSVSSIRLGRNPAMDAWLDHFLTENNLSYLLNPTLVATPEQLRFMVALEENQIYLPCSDAMFRLLPLDSLMVLTSLPSLSTTLRSLVTR